MLQQKTVALAIAITAAVVLLAFYIVAIRQSLDSSGKELTNEVAIERANQLKEAKIFLTKYPNASITVDPSGRVAVDYRISKWPINTNLTEPFQEMNPEIQPYLRLRILMNSNSEPQELFVDCWVNSDRHDSIIGIIGQKNVIQYLSGATCLG